MSLDSTELPNGLDWADGLEGRPGTPTPNEAVVTYPAETYFEENSDSPEIERAEQGTIQHRFGTDYDTGTIFLGGLGRGTFLTDSFGNVTKILSSRLTKQKGNRAQLSVTAESISFDTPPDDFDFETLELNPALEKHPRYAFLPSQIRLLVNQAVTAAQFQGQIEANNLLSTIGDRTDPPPTGTTWAVVQQAAQELLKKRFIGEDTFYLPGFRVVWSQYFYMPQPMNPGGYIEDPIDQGGLPAYFWSLDQTEEGLSIFSEMSDLNPQFYSEGISWLRLCDHNTYQRTWFKVTKTWLGAPFAHWDADIYSNDPSPYPPPPNRPIS